MKRDRNGDSHCSKVRWWVGEMRRTKWSAFRMERFVLYVQMKRTKVKRPIPYRLIWTFWQAVKGQWQPCRDTSSSMTFRLHLHSLSPPPSLVLFLLLTHSSPCRVIKGTWCAWLLLPDSCMLLLSLGHWQRDWQCHYRLACALRSTKALQRITCLNSMMVGGTHEPPSVLRAPREYELTWFDKS